MDDDTKALAERAVACKGWRWMEGMADQYRGRIVIAYIDGEVCRFDKSNWDDLDARMPRGLIPDLTDPATLGCLLALVRETGALVTVGDTLCTVTTAHGVWTGGADDLARCLVAALEAAP